VYLNILDPFESWKRFTAPQEHSRKFLQKKGGKNIPFLEGRRGGGGVARALTKKIDPG